MLLFGIACACSKSASNAPQPPPTVWDNPNNMVQQPLAKPPSDPPQLDNSCSKDDDCVPAPTCCPVPCNEEVINLGAMQKAHDRLASCPKDQVCPSAGSCRTFAYLCVQKKCALVFQGDPGFHEHASQ